MTKFFARFFIKNHHDISSSATRNKYGALFGIIGMILNLLLFASKFFVGLFSGSIAIIADSLNNAADGGSSIVTFLGFKLSEKKADPSHPFGHGRIEYISGLVVSLGIIIMGFELGVSSVKKFFSPSNIEFNFALVIILLASITVKLLMFFDGISLSVFINSPTVKATAIDSINDVASTSVVLISTLLTSFCNINADAVGGCIIAAFIVYSGSISAKETINPLLGQPPDPKLVRKIEETVLACPDIKDIHNLVVHDYGHGKTHVSFHAEVSSVSDPISIHASIEEIERQLLRTLGAVATIHTDLSRDNGESTDKTED